MYYHGGGGRKAQKKIACLIVRYDAILLNDPPTRHCARSRTDAEGDLLRIYPFLYISEKEKIWNRDF